MKIGIILSIFTLIILFCSCNAQEKTKPYTPISKNLPIRPPIKKIVDSMEVYNNVTSSHIGAGGVPSKQWENYKQLKQHATIDELIALTSYSNPAVRCYAFQALATKKSDKIFSILLTHLHDTAQVKTISGCDIGNEYVGDYFINVVTPKMIDLNVYKLTAEERKKLDDILAKDDRIILYARAAVLHGLKKTH